MPWQTRILLLPLLAVVVSHQRVRSESHSIEPLKGQNEDVTGLIRDLGDKAFRVREAAQRGLIRVGLPAVERLRAAAESADPEVARRAERALAAIGESYTRGEMKYLEGTWQLQEYVHQGERKGISYSDGQVITIAIKQGQFLVIRGGKEVSTLATIRLHPGSNPKAIDWLWEGALEGKTGVGIYRLKGQTLTFCCSVYSEASKRKRPTSFHAPAGSGHAIEIYKRVGAAQQARVDSACEDGIHGQPEAAAGGR
jgi:uncharacterized protein (TIGR03067 family)